MSACRIVSEMSRRATTDRRGVWNIRILILRRNIRRCPSSSRSRSGVAESTLRFSKASPGRSSVANSGKTLVAVVTQGAFSRFDLLEISARWSPIWPASFFSNFKRSLARLQARTLSGISRANSRRLSSDFLRLRRKYMVRVSKLSILAYAVISESINRDIETAISDHHFRSIVFSNCLLVGNVLRAWLMRAVERTRGFYILCWSQVRCELDQSEVPKKSSGVVFWKFSLVASASRAWPNGCAGKDIVWYGRLQLMTFFDSSECQRNFLWGAK